MAETDKVDDVAESLRTPDPPKAKREGKLTYEEGLEEIHKILNTRKKELDRQKQDRQRQGIPKDFSYHWKPTPEQISIAKKALKLVDRENYRGYVVIGRIPNSKRFDCYFCYNPDEFYSYGDLSYKEARRLVIYRMDLSDKNLSTTWKCLQFKDPQNQKRYEIERLDRLVKVLHDNT